MMFRTLLFALAGVLVAAPLQAAPTLNVLFINVDDMNCDSVGAFGCKVPDITPHIDKLASQGIRFEHAHVTIAICQPTRAVWMTGRYPHRNGALGFNPIRPEVPTLLEGMKDAGYYTGIFAKVPHVVPTRRKAWDVIVDANELKTGRDPKLYYQASKDFFQKAKGASKPFFLMANSQDPHRPFAGSAQEGKGKNFPAPSRTYKPDEVVVPGFLPDLPDVRKEIAQYFTSVHRADEIVGSILRALDEAGLADNTLVVFMSDHGMPLPFAKTNCWRHSTRTPWIVRWPGVVKPGRHDTKHLIAGIDLCPTILEATGAPALKGMDGRSLLPILKGQDQSERDHVFTHINTTAGKSAFPMRSIQTRKYGYIFNAWADGKTVFRNESQSGLTMNAMKQAAQKDEAIAARVKHFLYRSTEELYDYEKDPDALHNLIDDPAYRKERDRLRALMLEEMKKTEDPQLAAFQKVLARE
ncbi:MAG: sulfatase [Gemmataceae bacterium]